MLRLLEEEVERHRAAQQQLVKALEDANVMYESVERLRDSIHGKTEAIDRLEARRTELNSGLRAVERDLRAVVCARAAIAERDLR